MNTNTLRKQNPEIYQKFFQESDIVISAPAAFFWAGEHGIVYPGGLSIIQTLPMRLYMGIKLNNDGVTKLPQFLQFHNGNGQFSSQTFRKEWIDEVQAIMHKHLDKICADKSLGLEIRVFSECKPQTGLSSSAAFSSMLTILPHLLTSNSQMIMQKIAKWQTLPTIEVEKDPIWIRTLQQAWELERVFHSPIGSPTSVMNIFLGNGQPTIIFNQDSKTYFGRRLTEIFPHISLKFWPIDLGIIYSGQTSQTESVLLSIQYHYKNIKSKTTQLREIIKKQSLPDSFMHNFVTNGWLPYIRSIQLVTAEMLCSFEKLFSTTGTEESIRDLTTNIHRNQILLQNLQVSSASIDQISRYLQSCGLKFHFPVGAKLTGPGRGGSVIFLTPRGVIQNHIDKIIRRLNEITGLTITLEYANWLDDVQTEGIKIEQYISQGIYSEYVAKDALQLIVISPKGNPSFSLIKNNDSTKIVDTYDLCLDLVNEKIFIKGNKPDSKQLPSARATAKILGQILQSQNWIIKNSELPRSSYASNRNDLQSKIIIPLNKLLQKQFKQKLSFKIHGNQQEFTVQISSPLSMSVAIIKKIS